VIYCSADNLQLLYTEYFELLVSKTLEIFVAVINIFTGEMDVRIFPIVKVEPSIDLLMPHIFPCI